MMMGNALTARASMRSIVKPMIMSYPTALPVIWLQTDQGWVTADDDDPDDLIPNLIPNLTPNLFSWICAAVWWMA